MIFSKIFSSLRCTQTYLRSTIGENRRLMDLCSLIFVKILKLNPRKLFTTKHSRNYNYCICQKLMLLKRFYEYVFLSVCLVKIYKSILNQSPYKLATWKKRLRTRWPYNIMHILLLLTDNCEIKIFFYNFNDYIKKKKSKIIISKKNFFLNTFL